MSTVKNDSATRTPLANLDEWEDFLKERYPENAVGPNPDKTKDQFRDYENTRARVVALRV